MPIEWKRVRKYLTVATDIVHKLPAKGDGWLTTVVKLLAIADSFDQKLGKAPAVFSFFEKLDVTPSSNSQFVDLFFSTPLKNSFEVIKISLSEYVDIVIASDKQVGGSLYFLEYHWGARPEVSSDFWHTKGFDFKKVLERLWKLYDNTIAIGLRYEANRERPFTEYKKAFLPTDPLIGSALTQLDDLTIKHRRAKENGFARTYLFAGKQGVGKSTLALRFALACGKRVIQVNAQGLTVAGSNDLGFLINGLNPDFLILDDIDRIAEMATAVPRLLDTLSELKHRYSSVTVVLTANDASVFDPAILRPERVDKIIEFSEPNADERRTLLEGYLKEFKTTCSDPESVVQATEGLTAVYLKSIAIQIKNAESLSEVLEDIKVMKRFSVKPKTETPGDSKGTPPKT